MKTNNKIKTTSLDSELYQLFNDSLNYSPAQMKNAIKEATHALDCIAEEDMEDEDKILFREEFFLISEECE